jgi:MoaA/NifB/PqqE/SkfB family radical SAM enzyme
MMFSQDTIQYLRQAVRDRKVTRGPVDLQILPTTRCNATCTFCPQQAVPEQIKRQWDPRWCGPPEDLPIGLMDRLVDELYMLGGLKRMHITGGEPLLFKHIIPIIFMTRREFPDIEIALVTNGILLKDFAGPIAASGLDRLSVSLNAGTTETYRELNPAADDNTFPGIIAGIREVAEKKRQEKRDRPYISVTSVLTRENAPELDQMLEVCMEAGADALTCIPIMEFRRGDVNCNKDHLLEKPQFEEFMKRIESLSEKAREKGFYLGFSGDPSFQGALRHYDLYSKIPCYSGYTFAMVWPNGDVRPCCNCEDVLGNLKEQAFSSIWKSERAQAIRDRMLEICEKGPPQLCDCDECGYIYENQNFHRLVKGK